MTQSEQSARPDLPARADLPAVGRVTAQRDFKRAYQRGLRAGGHWISVVVLTRHDDARSRLGVSVSKDHGGAVRRNKLKRLLREAFRLTRAQLPNGLDIVLIPRQREQNFPLAALLDELPRLVHKACASKPRGNRRTP